VYITENHFHKVALSTAARLHWETLKR